MVKQILTILLLFVYSFSSIGATVKAHLCAGKVQKCICGKATKNKATTKDTCCAEKITFVKKQDLHQFNELATAKQPLLLATHPSEFYTLTATAPVFEQKAKAKVHSKKGLLFTGPPIYALDCLYLI
jgi:hypothetical protein